MCLGVETEERLGDLIGFDSSVVSVTRHLALARARHAVGIDGKQLAAEVSPGATQAAEGELERFGLADGMSGEQVVNGLIGSYEGQAIDQIESPLSEATGGAQVANSQGRFVDELQGKPGRKIRRRRAGPFFQQIPRPEAQMLGYEQPETHEVAGYLICQQLAHAAFDAYGIGAFAAVFPPSPEGLQHDGRAKRMKLIEFFFGVRSGQ